MYGIALLFFFCRGNLVHETHGTVGSTMIGLTGAVVVTNGTCMLYSVARAVNLWLARHYNR